jgi:hypothetical protein
MKLTAVLLSTGINNNTDVFLPEEILPIRNTGAHKPVNLEHDPDKIIGVMLRTYVTLKDGTRIKDDEEPNSDRFDVTAESVIYKFLFPEIAEEIKEKGSQNKLFVSVEAWFTDYDYLVGNEVVRRNDETSSVLEHVLRMNGGTGKFEGKTVGRVLRNIILGGIGIVQYPANPESVIKSISNIDTQDVQDIEDKVIRDNVIGDICKLSINSLSRKDEVMKAEVLEELAQVIIAQKASEALKSEKVEIPEEEISPFVKKLMERIEVLEASDKELQDNMIREKAIKEGEKRYNSLIELGLSDSTVDVCMSRIFFMKSKDFDKYIEELKLIVNDINNKNKIGGDESVKAADESGIVEGNKSVNSDESVTEEIKNSQDSGKEEIMEKVEEPSEKLDESKVEQEKTSEVIVEDKVEDKVEEIKEEVKEEVKEETKEEAVVETDNTQDTSKDDEGETEVDTIDMKNIDPVDPKINIETDVSNEPSLTEQMANVVQKFLKEKNPKWEKLAINK